MCFCCSELQHLRTTSTFSFSEILQEDLEIEEKKRSRGRITDLLTNGIFLLNLALISAAWFATGMMFYGLSIYMPEFKNTDIRLVTFLLGLAEIPADIVPIIALNRYENMRYSIRNFLILILLNGLASLN